MNRYVLAASALSSAVGLAFAIQAAPAQAAEGMKPMGNVPPIVKENMAKMQKEHLQKCFGINAVGKNDCAEGAHSCA
ncbi:MAG: DUF2282 domain-containing protein, partial [Betaproteobacteria bacterium]|nr:DUF2282 domain-containing protein [Betaproteobacteria bacterium]